MSVGLKARGADLLIPGVKGIPKWFVGQVFFGGPGAKAKKSHISQKEVIFGLAAEGCKAKEQ